MTLVILAAGMGSRFGGLKQIEPVGPNGEFILDYSIYDAIRNGFDKVVFIIKEENYDVFRETIGKRIEGKINVKYVFQNNSNIPDTFKIPEIRKKPLGTAHAILCCKDIVKDSFVIINADDFYGENAFKVINNYAKQNKDKNEFALIGYQVGNTMSKNGAVKRGICEIKGNYLKGIVESSVDYSGDKILATPLSGENSFTIDKVDLVSTNMWFYTPIIFDYLEEGLTAFLNSNVANLDSAEYLIPDVIRDLIDKKIINVRVLPTTAKWLGITYKEDKAFFIKDLNFLINKKDYPEKLWK